MQRVVEAHSGETVAQIKGGTAPGVCGDPGGRYLGVPDDRRAWSDSGKAGDGILTHCNAGQLATSKYGTATAPIYLGEERGYHFHVFADETRPLLQGARLTAFELPVFRGGCHIDLRQYVGDSHEERLG